MASGLSHTHAQHCSNTNNWNIITLIVGENFNYSHIYRNIAI